MPQIITLKGKLNHFLKILGNRQEIDFFKRKKAEKPIGILINNIAYSTK